MNEQQVDKTIAKVRELIKECQGVRSIDELLDLSLRISGYMVYLSEQETESFREWNQTVFKRKVLEAKFVKKSSESATKAAELAKVEHESFRENESIHESDYKKLQTFRVSVKEFLESLRQKISYLKQEQKTS